MLEESSTTPVIAFYFPEAVGHTNPALALARRLVDRCCRVEFIGCASFQEAIEGVGAVFHNMRDVHCSGEIAQEKTAELTNAGFQDQTHLLILMCMGPTFSEHGMAKMVDWLKKVKPSAMVYCPVMCGSAAIACRFLGIPCVSLMTTPGPGYLEAMLGGGQQGLCDKAQGCEFIIQSLETMRKTWQDPELTLGTQFPFDVDCLSPQLNLVTNVEELGDHVTSNHQAILDAKGISFEWVGPLIDASGAPRAGDETRAPTSTDEFDTMASAKPPSADLHGGRVQRFRSNVGNPFDSDILKATAKAGRQIIFVSMGTSITKDEMWTRSDQSSLTGKEVCQSVYRAVFDVFGDEVDDEDKAGTRTCPLIIVATGLERKGDALEDILVPGNAMCKAFVPQLEVLGVRPHLFVTHGGQNSIMEALSYGVPLLVCPGAYDQPRNAAKVQESGLGLKIDRPPEGGCDAATYQAQVTETLRKMVADHGKYASEVQRVSDKLASLDGVALAADKVLAFSGMALPTSTARGEA